MTEPTAALTFGDLILEVALEMDVAYYGADGTEEAQIPEDTHDLAECKRHVNNAIRMFISNAPANGWRWMRPILELTYWPGIFEEDEITATGTYSAVTKKTTVTASEACFYPSMELKTLTVADVGDITIESYTSTTVIVVDGDHSWAGSKIISLEVDGNYTLPQTFGGAYTGSISFAAGTNVGTVLRWIDEGYIRNLREDSLTSTGVPRNAAIRRCTAAERRYELMLYPIPSDEDTVQFPYDLYFDVLSEATELHPAGYAFDEAIRAACKMVVERDVKKEVGPDTNYYQQIVLPKAYQIDARSAPRRLGYCGRGKGGPTGIVDFRKNWYNRPDVTYS